MNLDKNNNSEKNYELRPKFNAKFTKEKVYGIIKSILDEKMEYFQGEYDHQKYHKYTKWFVIGLILIVIIACMNAQKN